MDHDQERGATAINGEKILASERYTTRAAAADGINAVKANAGNSDRYELKIARDAQLYFVLKAANHEVIGVSEMYTSGAAREGGIAAVKANASAAGVEG